MGCADVTRQHETAGGQTLNPKCLPQYLAHAGGLTNPSIINNKECFNYSHTLKFVHFCCS